MTSVLYAPLYLATGVRDVFLSWLGGVRPDLVGRYAEVCSKGFESSWWYRTWQSKRILPIIAEHGLPALNGQPPSPRRNRISRCCSEH